jgi:hypothetical protein
MPIAQEDALRKVAEKYAKLGKLKKKNPEDSIEKAKNAFIFGTMENMKKRRMMKK